MTDRSATRDDRYEVRSLVRGLRVLECLERTRSPMRLTDLASELGVERATLFRYCATLVGLGYLHHDLRTKQYSLGVRARSLAHAANAQWPSLLLIRDFLAVAAERFRGAASLGVLEGDQVLYVERSVAGQSLNFQLSIGDRLPAARSSIGKMLLAFEAEDRILRTVRAQVAPATRGQVLAEIHEAGRSGFALNLGGIQEGLNSVAVPVFEPGEDVPLGAINLAGGASILTAERLRAEVAPALQAFAEHIRMGTADEG